MEKDELITMLNESISMEEIPTISNLGVLKEMVLKSSIEDVDKQKMLENTDKLINQTLWHSKEFSDMINIVVKWNK